MREDIGEALTNSSMSAAERLRLLEMCRPRSAEELLGDLARIDEHLGTLHRIAGSDPTIDLPLAERIADALRLLVADRHRLTFEERRLLCGAISYFAMTADGSDDVRDLTGLDDDARIVRSVCAALGRSDIARTV